MRAKNRGFTLVELLVVIAIIAVLLAILLPVIGNAKFVADRAACAANMRTFVQALNGYAQAHKGALPPTMSAGSSAPLRMNPSGNTPPWNVLFTEKFLTDSAKSRDTYAQDPAGVTMRGAYYWNPHPGDPGAPNPALSAAASFTWPDAVPRWNRLVQIPQGRVIGCDLIGPPGLTSHRPSASSMNASWNLAYPDGSVQSVTSADVFLQMRKAFAPAKSQGVTWSEFNDYLRVLELIVQGRDPKLANGGFYYWQTNQKNAYYPPAQPGAAVTD